MAEAIHDDDSPHARAVSESATSDDEQADAAVEVMPSTSRRSSPTDPTPPPPPSSDPPKRSRRQVAAIERVKYAIATSGLLSAKLADALQVYPPLDTLEARQRAPRSFRSRASNSPSSSDSFSAARISGNVKGKIPVRAADWGDGWETRGQGVTERGVLGSAQAALTGLVGALGRLSVRDAGPLASVCEEGADDPPKAQASLRAHDQPSFTPHDALLSTVEEFLTASQELDLRVGAALTAIKELECIAHGLGISDPLPPISRIEARSYLPSPKPPSPTSIAMASTPSRSPRIPSPLAGPSKPSNSGAIDKEVYAPPSLRALALRKALALAISSAAKSLSSSIAALNTLLPPDSPLLMLTSPSTSMTPTSTQGHAPQASLSELLRHDSLARAERSEVSRWEEGSAATSTSRPSSIHLGIGDAADVAVDPFHPTESTFGGIDRRTGESGTPLKAGSSAGKHRLRVSLGTQHGGSPVIESAVSARRKRPVSMGGLDAASLEATRGSFDETFGRDSTQESDALHRVLLVSLQDRFDDVHDARRGVIWRLLEALDHASSESAWLAAESALTALSDELVTATKTVAAAHAHEFPDNSIVESGSLAISGKSPNMHVAASDTKEKRRRNGFYARSEADDLPIAPSNLPSTPTPSSRRPLAPGDNSAPSPSAALYARRATVHTHAHAASVGAVDPALAVIAQQMTLSMRAVQAKVRVVLADAMDAREGSAAERDRVVEVWGSMREEIARLEKGWKDGAGTLRKALGLMVTEPMQAGQAEEEAEGAVHESVMDGNDGDLPASDELNATGAEYATLDTSDAPGEDPVANRQAVLDAALSASLLPPADSDYGADRAVEEKIFEAVAGPERRAPSGEKLSRDERIRRMKEAREALALGRISLESPTKGPSGETNGAETQRNMVGELREVLKELNRDKNRTEGAPSSSAATLPPPPIPRAVASPTAQPAWPPAPGPKPTVPAIPVQQVSAIRLPPLQPAYEQQPPPSPTKAVSSPTAHRVPPQPLPRGTSQPHADIADTDSHHVPPVSAATVPDTQPPVLASTARYASPPALPPQMPAPVPTTPGKQQTPRYVSPPPLAANGRTRAGSLATTLPFASPGRAVGPGSQPSTPGKQQAPRYVSAPPLSPSSGMVRRTMPPAPLQPQSWYGASPSSMTGTSMGAASPTGPQSPIRGVGVPAELPGDGARYKEDSADQSLDTQRNKRPSVQTV